MLRIVKSFLTIAIVAAIAVGATGAYFSDSETSTGNSFTTGTLDLKVDDQDTPLIQTITLVNMKPGDTQSYFYNWKNAGSITGAPSITFLNLLDYENGIGEAESSADTTPEGELSSKLLMKVNAPGSTGYVYPNAPECFAASGTGSECPLNVWDNYLKIGAAAPWEIWQTILGGATNASMVLEFRLPSTVGNEVQSDSATFDIEFNLDQVI